MVFPPELLDLLQATKAEPWKGVVYRHMFASYSPTLENTRGARWNPRGVAAIYTSVERETALGEANYRLSLEPLRPRARRAIYSIRVTLHHVLDLRSMKLLQQIGIDDSCLGGVDLSACQQVGGAAAWLDHDGLLVPSARGPGGNLVIFPAKRSSDAVFEVIASEIVEESTLP
jgi:RES domain-containing protein